MIVLNVLKLLGMKCDENLLTWPELVERCESIQRLRDYHHAHERSLALLHLLNDMLIISNSPLPRPFDETDESTDRRSRQQGNNPSNNISSSSQIHEALHDKEAKKRAALQLRELPFIPIKGRPIELNGIRFTWMGEKYLGRLFKPKDILSQQYEQLICSSWPIAQQSKNAQEQPTITKQVEHFLGLDDTSKIDLRDVLKQLDELPKLSVTNESNSTIYNHQITSKYILEMSYSIYEYIQFYCFPHLPSSSDRPMDYRSSSMATNQLEQCIREVREFFNQRRLIYMNDHSSNDTYLFLSLSQLLWQSPPRTTLSNDLKPYFYSIPTLLQKNLKNFFVDLLQIKLQIDGKDLLHIIEQIKKKYGTKPIDKDDLTLLQNIYTLLIEHYGHIFTGNLVLYLPNMDCVLHSGSTLYFYPLEREQLCKNCSRLFLFFISLISR